MKKKRFVLASVAFAGILFLGVILAFGKPLSGKEDISRAAGSQMEVNDNVAAIVKDASDVRTTEAVELAVEGEVTVDNVCPITGLPIGSGAGGMGRYLAGTMHDIIAEELGMTADELRVERLAGRSIAEIAEERGIDFEELKATVIEARAELLEKLGEDGVITEGQKNYMEQNMERRMETMMERNTVGPANGQGKKMRQGNDNCPLWGADGSNQPFRQGGNGFGHGNRFAN